MESWPAEAPELIAAIEAENAVLRAESAAQRDQLATQVPRVSALDAWLPMHATSWSKRWRSGQLGDVGHRRQTVPIGKADRALALSAGCGESHVRTNRQPRRYQLLDIPPLRLEVTEYKQHRWRCKVGGMVTTETLPASVTERKYGVGTQSLFAMLGTRYQHSRRQIADLFKDMFGDGPGISTGTNLERPVKATLAPPWRQMRPHVRTARIMQLAETSCIQCGSRERLWSLGYPKDAAWLRFQPRRSRLEVNWMLGETKDNLVCDRHCEHDHYPNRQINWAYVRCIIRCMDERHSSEWHFTLEQRQAALINNRAHWDTALRRLQIGATAPESWHHFKALASASTHLWSRLWDIDAEPGTDTSEYRLRHQSSRLNCCPESMAAASSSAPSPSSPRRSSRCGRSCRFFQTSSTRTTSVPRRGLRFRQSGERLQSDALTDASLTRCEQSERQS